MVDNTKLQKVQEITDQLEEGIKQMFESSRYQNWLDTMSRFHRYSLNNTLLIAFQKPDASLVAGYTAWQKNFGRQVLKGEKAIKIIAPTPYKEKVEVEKIDPATKKPLLNADGQPQKEEKEITRTWYKVVNVFDVSQTEGRELPTLGVDELTGDVAQYERFIEALKKSCPVPISFEDVPGMAKGFYDKAGDRIVVKSGMSQQQTLKTLIHEMTHQRLHGLNQEEQGLSRSGKEVEAESVAYTICKHYGIDTSDYSFGYIAGWSSGKEMPELKDSLMTIRKTASTMIKEIDEQFETLEKEQAKRQEKEETKKPSITFYAAECGEFSDLGEYHETESLQEAIRLMEKIPPERLNAIPAVGFILHDGSIYDGLRYPLFSGNQLYTEEVNMMGHYRESPLVQKALAECERYFEKKNQYYEASYYSQAQKDLFRELEAKGYDLKMTWINGQPQDLTVPMSKKEIEEVRYQMMVDTIPKAAFSKKQWEQIESGITLKLDVPFYADPAFSPEQMNILKISLMAYQNGYLSKADLNRIKDPSLNDKEMADLVESIGKNNIKRMNEQKEKSKTLSDKRENEEAKAPSKKRSTKKSVLDNLHEKQSMVSGAKAPKTERKRQRRNTYNDECRRYELSGYL